MRKRALLFGALLVVIVLTASGCIGGLFGGLIGDPERDKVNEAVNAFLEAWEEENADGMGSRLAATVAVDINPFGVEGEMSREVFLQGAIPPPDPLTDYTEVRFVQGPSSTVSGSNATATGRIAMTYVLSFQDFRVRGAKTRLDLEDYEDELSVEDTYPVEFGLQKSGSDWVISNIVIGEGARQGAIKDSWMVFA